MGNVIRKTDERGVLPGWGVRPEHQHEDVSKVTGMESMFAFVSNFNQPLGIWNMSSVRNRKSMFFGARSLDQYIGSWNISAVLYNHGASMSAAAFNQDLSRWCVNCFASEPTNWRVTAIA